VIKLLATCCACACAANQARETVVITLESISVYDLWLSDQDETADPYDWDFPPEPETLIDFYPIDDADQIP
jgi:hypothetical protein